MLLLHGGEKDSSPPAIHMHSDPAGKEEEGEMGANLDVPLEFR